MSGDLISCVVVTRPLPDRVPRLRLTLQDFARQTHPTREMIIVVDAPDEAAAAPVLQAVADSGVEAVSTHVAGGPMTLGALRNLSWALAQGDIICSWDDDDRHHPARLAQQWAALDASGAQACFLQEYLQFFAAERRLYRVNFRPAPDPIAVNTPMVRRDIAARYPETGPQAQKSEDVALFHAIAETSSYTALADQPHLFVYVAHGRNTCTAAHHWHLVDQMGASQGWLRRSEERLRAGLALFDFGPEPIIVTGRNGDAFVL